MAAKEIVRFGEKEAFDKEVVDRGCFNVKKQLKSALP